MTAEEELALDIARDLIWNYDYMYIYEEACEKGLDAYKVEYALRRIEVTL